MSGKRRPRIAFCGLGRMGRQMATRVIEGGYPTSVWNRTSGAARALAEETGATASATPASAARGAEVVITMLTDGPALLAVLTGEEGVLAGIPPGSVVVDCSTIGPEMAREASELCSQAGIAFIDSPVSGSTAVASRGELGLMVGGDPRDLARVEPVLATFGRTIVHVGPTGAGAAAKVAVNGLLHTFSTALAETLVTAEAAGVSRSSLFDVLLSGVLANTFLGYKRDAFIDPESGPVAFDLDTATKDLRLASAATRESGLNASIIERALQLHERALTENYGDRDMAAMAAWFSAQSNAGHRLQACKPTQPLERT